MVSDAKVTGLFSMNPLRENEIPCFDA
jgi:hypothetical protein